MKKILYTILMCFAVCEVNGQVNLVSNGSFESYSQCPELATLDPMPYTLLELATGWINPTDYSPDYFNACAPYTPLNSYSVPENLWGFQDARTGSAYVGLVSAAIGGNGREYIQTKLTEPLITGKKYLVTFYVSLSEKCTYASNNIGAYFSNTPVSSNDLWFLPYTPQISNNHIINPLTDMTNWIEVSDTLTALGGEKYITIGNFNDDATTDTTNKSVLPSPWWTGSYHYLDDVSVVCLDCPVGISETDIDSRVTVFPNPTSEYLNLSFDDIYSKKITIFNSIGETLLIQEQASGSNSIQINVAQYDLGLYFLKIETENTYTTKRFLITK